MFENKILNTSNHFIVNVSSIQDSIVLCDEIYSSPFIGEIVYFNNNNNNSYKGLVFEISFKTIKILLLDCDQKNLFIGDSIMGSRETIKIKVGFYVLGNTITPFWEILTKNIKNLDYISINNKKKVILHKTKNILKKNIRINIIKKNKKNIFNNSIKFYSIKDLKKIKTEIDINNLDENNKLETDLKKLDTSNDNIDIPTAPNYQEFEENLKNSKKFKTWKKNKDDKWVGDEPKENVNSNEFENYNVTDSKEYIKNSSNDNISEEYTSNNNNNNSSSNGKKTINNSGENTNNEVNERNESNEGSEGNEGNGSDNNLINETDNFIDNSYTLLFLLLMVIFFFTYKYGFVVGLKQVILFLKKHQIYIITPTILFFISAGALLFSWLKTTSIDLYDNIKQFLLECWKNIKNLIDNVDTNVNNLVEIKKNINNTLLTHDEVMKKLSESFDIFVKGIIFAILFYIIFGIYDRSISRYYKKQHSIENKEYFLRNKNTSNSRSYFRPFFIFGSSTIINFFKKIKDLVKKLFKKK